MNSEKRFKIKILTTLLFVFLGVTLNVFNIGLNETFNFSTVGNYLIYIGFIGLIVSFLTKKKNSKKIVDERMIQIAFEASRWTIVFFVIISFALIIFDAIMPITMEYKYFLSYLVCTVILFHLGAYMVLLKKK